MSREILFRGKNKDSGLWHTGLLVKASDNSYKYKNYILEDADFYISEDDKGYMTECIKSIDFYEVDGDTVCQYTRLTDKYGKKIFEGDIIKVTSNDCIGIVKFGEHDVYEYGYYIDWISEKANCYREDILYWVREVRIEVIGNIYDNPELLK